MPDLNRIKTQLVRDLWSPRIKIGGNSFYPRVKKNKKMKVLTLTTDTNFEEINTFVNEKLTQRKVITAWTYSHIKKFRLETDIAPSTVFGASRYEDSISSASFPLNDCFPFDVINLDFSSQDPLFDSGRVEKELVSLEKTIRLQRDNGSHKFILIYTTLLNSHYLNLNNICNASDSIQVQGWEGLVIDGFPPSITDNNQKISCIENILSKLSQKYNYNVHFEKRDILLEGQKTVLSIVGLLGISE